MNRIWRFAALLLILPASALSASSPDERLVSPELPGFTVIHSESSAIKSVEVQVPEGESAQHWTRMVTTQWFKKLANRLTPSEYADKIVATLPRTCPDATVSPIETHKIGGRKSARLKVVCPDVSSGQAESFMMLAIAGKKKDMFVKQVAFPGKASAADFLWARKFLEGVALCREGSDYTVCQ